MERQPSDPNPFENVDLHLFDRVVGIGLAVGRLLGRVSKQVGHDPRLSQSDHYREPGASIKAVHQIPRNYDANGSEVNEELGWYRSHVELHGHSDE